MRCGLANAEAATTFFKFSSISSRLWATHPNFELPLRVYADLPSSQQARSTKRRRLMLEAIALILLILWFAGMFTAHTMGGLIHVLLGVAILMILFRLFQRKKTV